MLHTFSLKIIAIVSMLMDHMGYLLFPEAQWMRIFGRLAFPIFAYTLTEGCAYTSNRSKYLVRLGAFALVSEVPFDLMVYGKAFVLENQNVFFTLFFGALMLILLRRTNHIILQFIIVAGAAGICRLMQTDYDAYGIIQIYLFDCLRTRKKEQVLSVCVMNLFMTGGIQKFSALAAIPIALHNGKRGPKMKALFYLFYPVHMLVLYYINILILKG